jgi:hypothetical protein
MTTLAHCAQAGMMGMRRRRAYRRQPASLEAASPSVGP